MALAHLGWLAAALIASIAAMLTGAPSAAIGGAGALAAAPCVVAFVLMPRLGETWAQAALVGGWLLAIAGLAGGSGGALSPLAAGFAVPVALAAAISARFVAAAVGASVLGYALAAGLAVLAPKDGMGVWAPLMTAAALAFAGALIAVRPQRAARAAVAPIASVSHELRTPLTHILGFAEMIERQVFGPLDERYRDYAGLIRASGAQLLDLVNSLLDVARVEAGRYEVEYETFDARELLHEAMRLAAGAAGAKSVSLVESAPEAPVMVRADVRAFRQILNNIVGNAIKFTPADGRVKVTASRDDGALVIDTEDTGPGFPKAGRAKLGTAYERGANGALAEGTGLGLMLAQSLAALHGGAVSVHDGEGGGALVRVRLPILAEP